MSHVLKDIESHMEAALKGNKEDQEYILKLCTENNLQNLQEILNQRFNLINQ